MEKFEELFDKEIVENISNFVEEKMKLLKDVEDFKEKDKKLTISMEELDKFLTDELQEKFDEVMRLNYQVEEYYFTLAFLLGMKYGGKISKI